MGKKSKGSKGRKFPKGSKAKSKISKSMSRMGSIPSPQSTRNVNFEGNESVTYTAVPLSESEDSNAEPGGGAAPSPSKSNLKKSKQKEKKKRKRTNMDDSDDDFVELKRKPSPVVAPLPALTKDEYEFFEMVREGDIDGVAAFIQSNSFKDMDINKLNKSGFTILHIAVLHQDEDMVRLLLEQPGILLYDTLLYSIREENVEITKLLLEQYDLSATAEQRQALMNSALNMTQDPNQQEQLSNMVNTTVLAAEPVVSPLSTRSGVKSSVKLNNSSRTVGKVPKKSKLKTDTPRSFYEPKTDIPSTSSVKPSDDNDEIPFDSEFSPVVTPLMLAAQLGNYSLIELFYSRKERLETEEFSHDLDCSCDICAKLEGEQDMTRAYQRYHLYKALTNPDYMCFIGRYEHKDPINYALKKIVKLRELIRVDNAFTRLYDGFEEELEAFITKMLELCRSTNEAEIFLSPKDADERLPHLYPRLWYTVGQKLQRFVSSPNAQSIVYKIWADDDWPEWDTYNKYQRIFEGALRVLLWPFFGILLLIIPRESASGRLTAPVSRFLTYIGSYLFFMMVIGIQALYPYQRCETQWQFWKNEIHDDQCKKRGPPRIGTEWVLVIYILGFYMSMLKRQTVSWFWRMRWNWIELLDQLLFTATFCCWGYAAVWARLDENKKILEGTQRTMWPEESAEIIGECLLSMSFLFAFGRLLRFIIVIPACGPIQIGLGHQVVDFVKGIIVMSVVIVAFMSGLMGLYMPYVNTKGYDKDDKDKSPKTQDDCFQSVRESFKTLFWILQGKKGHSTTTILAWETTNKLTGEVEEIHHSSNELTGKILFMSYHMIGALMMNNMLAGYFSQTMTQITENLDMYWKYARTELFLTFVKDTVVPPPLNLFPRIQRYKKPCKWCKHLGRKDDPKASCSLRQCCFITGSKKQEKWKDLMDGYRMLILQLIFRYMNSQTKEKGKEPATKDDVLEIAENMAEIKSMLNKALENIESQGMAIEKKS